MQKKGAHISLSSYDEIFSTEESRAEARLERVQNIPLSELKPGRKSASESSPDKVVRCTRSGCFSFV